MLRRSNQAQKTNADAKNTFHYATRTFVLSLAALATACGSHSAMNPSNPVPAIPAAVNISASLPAATVGAGGVTLALSDGTSITFSNLTSANSLSGKVQYG